MNKVAAPEKQILLHLDLSKENQVTEKEILEQLNMPQPPRTFRATNYNVQRSGRGWDPELLRDWSRAIGDMLDDARSHLDRETQVIVAGMAGLPAFAELGIRLSGWSSNVTLINCRRVRAPVDQDSTRWDVCPLSGGTPSVSPYFDIVRGLDGMAPVRPQVGSPWSYRPAIPYLGSLS